MEDPMAMFILFCVFLDISLYTGKSCPERVKPNQNRVRTPTHVLRARERKDLNRERGHEIGRKMDESNFSRRNSAYRWLKITFNDDNHKVRCDKFGELRERDTHKAILTNGKEGNVARVSKTV